MFLLIDNYDSFTYNLVQAFQMLGHDPAVYRNDDPAILDLAARPGLEAVCLSPGPGRPAAAGLCLEFMKILDAKNPAVPVLGVCLGHQVLGQYGGGEIYVGDVPMHGKTSEIKHDGAGLFRDIAGDFTAGRYHSLLVRPTPAARFAVTATAGKGEVMALAYKDRPWVGVQFHPESVLTPRGLEVLINFFRLEKPAEKPAPQAPEVPWPLPALLERVAQGQDLDQETAGRLFGRLMDGELTPAQAGALLMGLRAKGETPLEVAEAAAAVVARAVKLPFAGEGLLDVVGTGGDGKNSFNCSTATALIMAALGHRVLKHGNRSVSSRCGSADVLERLGFDLNATPEESAELLRRKNFAFLMAPKYHPAFRHVVPVRKELGIRTLFNILGPLVNPGRVDHSFLGAPNAATLPIMAGAMARLGTKFTAVVHGAGGYDEMTALGPAEVWLVDRGYISQMAIDPAQYGFEPCDPAALAISGPEEGEGVLRELLAGRGPEPMRQMLALNVAMALFVVKEGRTEFGQCVKEAREAVKGGVGLKTLG